MWPYMLNVGWSPLRGLVWSIAALYVIMTVSVWVATLRTLGLSSIRRCPRMIRLSFRASPIRELAFAILSPFLMMALASALGVGAGFITELPWRPLILVASLCPTLFLVPPTVLVFSSSTNRQLRWALALKRFTGGRRVISLLDTGYMTVKPRFGDFWSVISRRSATLTDVLRTSDTKDWQSGVKELIELSPIVVVDTRVCTRALVFEASAVLAPAYAHKAIFVSEDSGRCPLLERLLDEGHIHPRSLVSVVKEDELGLLLKRLVRSKDTLPKPGSFASAPSMIAEAAGRCGPKPRARPPSLMNVPQDSNTSRASGPDSRRRLSSALTPFWRLLAKGVVVHLITSTAFCLWLTLALPQRTLSGFGASTLWSLLVCNWVGCVTYFHLAHSLKNVYIAGDSLFVSDSSKESEIHLSQIDLVTGPDWTTLRRITLHLHSPSAPGKKIVFAGRFLSAGMTARELRCLIYSHAEGKIKAPYS